MASLTKRHKQYCSQVSYEDEFGVQKRVVIPLRTTRKAEAEVRNKEVESLTTTIQQDRGYKHIAFGWLSGGGRTKIVDRTIYEVFEEYISVKRIDGVRESTIELNQLAIDSFTKQVGENVAVFKVTESHINEWKGWSRKHHSPNTTNIYLAKLKTFFRFCYKKRYLKRELDIIKVDADVKPPMYLSDEKLKLLFVTDCVDIHYRKAFAFYVATGCRLKEPFEGTISGNWLIITPDVAKAHKTREIELSPQALEVLLEMRQRYDDKIGKSMHGSWSNTHDGIIDTYSKKFKKAAKELGFGEHKFHNLRDTFAVRRWIETGDIYAVSKEIGHSSVIMTQKYANFNLRKLAVDFPSLNEKYIQPRLNDRYGTNDALIEMGGFA